MPDSEHNGADRPRRRRGRKTILPNLQEVENLAARGLNLEEIAHNLKIGLSTLKRRLSEFRDFRDAIRRGRAGLHLVGANIMFEAMRGFVRLKLPDQPEQIREISPEGQIQAAIFILRTRAGWRDVDPAQVMVTIFGEGGVSDADAERQVTLQQLSKYTVEERLKMREIMLIAQARMKREKTETVDGESRPVDDGDDDGGNGTGGMNGNG
jgi:hypothetical protein